MQGYLLTSLVAPLFILAQKHDTTNISAIHRRNEIPHLFPPAGRFLFPEVATTPPQEIWNGRPLKLGLHCITWSKNSLSATCSAFSSNMNQSSLEAGSGRGSSIETSEGSPYQRRWTNILLASNVLVYVAQIATRGRLMQWGAKINTKIDRGELRRLVTSSFLHVNIMHLLINCFSLYSVGPSVETIFDPQKFIAVYFTSAVASSAMSYWFCKASSVGASGAICGLVGSIAVYSLRRRVENERATKNLQEIAKVIALNMAIGFMWKGIDHWGHSQSLSSFSSRSCSLLHQSSHLQSSSPVVAVANPQLPPTASSRRRQSKNFRQSPSQVSSLPPVAVASPRTSCSSFPSSPSATSECSLLAISTSSSKLSKSES